MPRSPSPLAVLESEIVGCRRCPRLVEHREQIARVKRRAWRDWTYWGRPVPGFGDPKARLLIVGLAPAAHGANRTGRMFTGDSSGDLLYRVLYETGFASHPESRSRDDGLTLRDAYITAPVHCAPPGNKPATAELHACRQYLAREVALLDRVRVVVALGRIAFDSYLWVAGQHGAEIRKAALPFGHAVEHRPAPGLPVLLCSYHPSRQNTSTGKLTEPAFRRVFERARDLIGANPA